jgi:translation initiation factor 1
MIPAERGAAMPRGGWREFEDPRAGGSPLQRPGAGAEAATPRARQRVRVQRTKAGKGGRTVTVITGLEMPEPETKALLKRLKAACGTGGTLKPEAIELQGDQVAAALAALEGEGFRPKRSGG